MKKLFILLLVGILCLTSFAGATGVLAHIEIPGPATVIQNGALGHIEIPGPATVIHKDGLDSIEIPGPVVRASGTYHLNHIEIPGPAV